MTKLVPILLAGGVGTFLYLYYGGMSKQGDPGVAPLTTDQITAAVNQMTPEEKQQNGFLAVWELFFSGLKKHNPDIGEVVQVVQDKVGTPVAKVAQPIARATSGAIDALGKLWDYRVPILAGGTALVAYSVLKD